MPKCLMNLKKRLSMKNNLLPIAKEGFKYISCAVIATFVFNILDFGILTFLSFISVLVLLFLFRNPERENITYAQNALVSSTDGKVISIDEIKNDSEFAYKVMVESSCLDVSLLRIPMDSKLINFERRNGARLSKSSKLFSQISENISLIFEDMNKNTVKIQHTLKQSIAPIKVNVIKAQNLRQGERYGLMINGITTIYLPQNFRFNLTVGNELKASQTLIGYFS